ncbi:MAG: amino acid adenylation domain-containing protein [Planctomycetota bacterium]|jgi:amino acid adenylation domain-containing protein
MPSSPSSPDDALAGLGRFDARIAAWAGKAVEFPRESGIPELLRECAARNPDKAAIVLPDTRAHEQPESATVVTYAELVARSSNLAVQLRGRGIGAGDRVGLLMHRSVEALVAMCASMEIGAAYVPLDPAYPEDRLRFMIEDTAPRLILTEAGLAHAPLLQGSASLIVGREPFVSEPENIESDPSESEPIDLALPERAAYVMYTSGSTGQPKGVVVSQRAIVRLVRNNDFARLDDTRAWLQLAPLSFDPATLEIWGPLLNGGTCVVYPDPGLPDFERLEQVIRAHGVTSMWLTASLFNLIIDERPSTIVSVEEVLTGGEALSVPHIVKALRLLPSTQLVNGYGPTENTTFSSCYRIPRDLPASSSSVPIGTPISNTFVFVLDEQGQPVPIGEPGELFVGGDGLAQGYWQRPELTAAAFTTVDALPGMRLYRTGDRVRWSEGLLEFIGRVDDQIKLHGFRIELGEIEAAVRSHVRVRTCTVLADRDDIGNARLIAYLVAEGDRLPVGELRDHLATRLPEFMLPAAWVWLPELPLNANGKVDRSALPRPPATRPELAEQYQAPIGPTEERICAAFSQALGIDRVGRADNFFDLGGNSLLVLRVLSQLARDGIDDLTTNAFFRQPTPSALAIASETPSSDGGLDQRRMSRHSRSATATANESIAVIAVAGRFPGARDVEEFWENLCAGRDTISRFKDADLDGSLPASLTSDPLYVKARGVIADVDQFDAAFFGISPREAELMDPQFRVFLELCWECLERGGYAPDGTTLPVGVFAGMHHMSYLQRHVSQRPDLVENMGEFQVLLANEKDYLATRTAHRLNLTGPAVSLYTACSTSLVAIAQAVASLRSAQCDMALAGGVSITCPPNSGYLFQDGAMLSPDGRTRTFDADAQGTVFSDGAAVVLLKRLKDAVADGDPIHAVIRGVAVNNDGRDKASFTAPSVDGQAAVIRSAHAAAGVDPRSISYVEAHGTATPLGDPVELEGLTRAFRYRTQDSGFCRIGSVKSNVGHLVIAAGAAGVIKTALALESEQIPASIHFKKPNAKFDLSSTPFIVNRDLTQWPRVQEPRRAGVSSFGIGGTNAHVVMEEAPPREVSSPATGVQLLLLSARTRTALQSMAMRLADHLDAEPQVNLADVAHTLQVGRSRFAHRMCIVSDSAIQAAEALRASDHQRRARRELQPVVPSLVWMFPGQGAQYAGMGRWLYEHDQAFRSAFDECCVVLADVLPFDLKATMFGDDADALVQTGVTQPATFCLEYSLAQAWLASGAQPAALIGHSVGEFVAAVLAGVMSLADAARLVAERGAMMQELPAGSMLSVRLSAEELLPMLPEQVSLAAENGRAACVAAGPTAAIEALRKQLAADGIAVRLLQTSHAFHSAMMDPIVAPFERRVRAVALAAPSIPIFSSLTGATMTDAEACNPSYWARHLREPVRFSRAVATALAGGSVAFLEVGPRGTLATLARQHAGGGATGAAIAVATLAAAPDEECAAFALARGQLWTLGIDLPAPAASPSFNRRRVRLPTYPFERKRYWIEAGRSAVAPVQAVAAPSPALDRQPANGSVSPPTPNTPVMPTTAQSPAPGSRREQLTQRLCTLFEDIAGVDLSAADPAADFVELGLDSLTLTQAAMQVKKHFKVNITFRQLMESYRTFQALAEFLDSSLPVEAPVEAPGDGLPANDAPAATQAVDADHALGDPLVQQVLAQQMQLMQLMSRQLTMLGVDATAVVPPAMPATTIPDAAGLVPAITEAGKGTIVRNKPKKAFGAIARICTQPNEITEQQHARLQAFMGRYIERTKKSKGYTQQHRHHLADPRVVNGFRPATKEITYQIVVERSLGAKLWDIDGNEYVDVLSGFGMNLFGWQPDFITDALRQQIDSGYEIGPQQPLAGEVARLVCELTGNDRAGLCNTGSEAVMAAVRIARTVTNRDTVVVFTGSYHGTFDEVIVRAGRGSKGIPAAPGIMAGMFGDVRVIEYGTPESLEFIRAHADDLAAVLVEPVQSRRPELQPVDFLREVRAITKRSGTCLIFDEVITGFRAHLGGAQAVFGIQADIATYGKVIGGGLPIGVVAGRRSYMDALDGGHWQYGDDSIPTVGVTYFAGTFVRHPLALAAAKAALEHLKQKGPELQALLNQRTDAMADEMNAFCHNAGVPLSISHFASLWRISWHEDHPLQDLLYAMMRSRGVHILDNFPCFLTTAHTPQDIKHVTKAFKESVRELQEAGFLPRTEVAAQVFHAGNPPVPGARLGKDEEGQPAWFVPSASDPSTYKKFKA